MDNNKKETNTYNVSLVNSQGCNFDNASFTSLRKAKIWAYRGGSQMFKVYITKNGEEFLKYQTR